jgi:hypothetical protein
MEVTARTDNGSVIAIAKKEYREIGVDVDGNERLGAWQIKEIIDLSLPPNKKTHERFLAEFPENTKSADIEVVLKYYLTPAYESVVHTVTKKVSFGK